MPTYYLIAIDEKGLEEINSAGQAKLSLIDRLTPTLTGEKPPETHKVIKQYRELARKFAPVHAGVEWAHVFLNGGGFQTNIDDPENKVMKRNKKEIDYWNAYISMDYYNQGFDRILDLLTKPALVDGFSAAEIVYEKELKFADYVTDVEETQLPNGEKEYDFQVDTSNINWRSLKGVQRLKIIDDAIWRLEPIRDIKSFEVKYWILDKGQGTETYLLPEQLFVLGWNTEGTSLIGESMVASVATVAMLLREILNAIGVNFRRWGNKRYFLIMGTPERPYSPTHVANLLKDVKTMVDKNKMAVAAPAGFDYKEIGGEIFEGRNVIDTMLGIIAAGMQFPKEFLESPRTQASDKSWLAWLIKNSRNQRQVRRAVEQQLWEKHLWCKFGKTFKVSKKGVKVEDQEKQNQYVPKLRWRTEGRWHIADRIKMLKSL